LPVDEQLASIRVKALACARVLSFLARASVPSNDTDWLSTSPEMQAPVQRTIVFGRSNRGRLRNGVGGAGKVRHCLSLIGDADMSVAHRHVYVRMSGQFLSLRQGHAIAKQLGYMRVTPAAWKSAMPSAVS